MKLTNLKFWMFICASFEFLKFRVLINFNAKFNVFLQVLLYFQHGVSRHQLAGSLIKKTLTIGEKIKILDASKRTRQSCRQLADQFLIGKTAAAKIVTNEASIRQEYERFKGNLKRNRRGQFHKINEILYEWFKKCCELNIYPDW